MFKRFTAAAVSTVLSVSAVLPCTVNASDDSKTKLNPYIVTGTPKNAPNTAAITAAEAAKTGRYSFEVSSCFVYFKADRQFMSGAISER